MNTKHILLCFWVLLSSCAYGQIATEKEPLRVALFTQLYLDSAFKEDGLYQHDMQMPRYILPGLDFTEGFIMALDSIKTDYPLEVKIYDIRSESQTINALETANAFDSIDLMIGAVSGNEYRQLAEIALQYQIPFLSATFPNDGGITDNPYTILLNPTIAVHCQGIIRYLQKSYPNANHIFLQKGGTQEEKIRRYYESANVPGNGRKSLNWKVYTAGDSLRTDELIDLLDSTKQNIIICGSFDEKLAVQCLHFMTDLSAYNVQLAGLPNWETLKELNLPRHKSKTIYYTSAFFNDGSASFSDFQKRFLEKTQGKASDVAYKGYDAAYNFIRLLIKHDINLINQLNDASFQHLIQYNIQPVKSTGKKQPDYFENKRIYIIKKSNGVTTKTDKQ